MRESIREHIMMVKSKFNQKVFTIEYLWKLNSQMPTPVSADVFLRCATQNTAETGVGKSVFYNR
jgi:hypothetical protein